MGEDDILHDGQCDRGDPDHAHPDHGHEVASDDRHGHRAHSRDDHDVDTSGADAAYFDGAAATWDDQDKVDRSRVIALHVRGLLQIDQHTSLLEYGAGTGLGAQLLTETGPLGDIVLAEPSEGMRAVAAQKRTQGELPSDTRILDLDLVASAPLDEVFDIVMTVMTLHHIPQVARAVAGLAAMTRRGGHVVVADLQAEDGTFHQDLEDFDGHNGFDESHMRKLLTDAGLEMRSLEQVTSLCRHGVDHGVFVAVAARP